MTFHRALLWAAAATLAFMGVAHAAPAAATEQAIPYGSWLATALLASTGLLTTVASALVIRYVPAAYRLFLTPAVVAEAVHFAVATMAGAVKGQTLSVQQLNGILGEAEKYVIENEPALARWLAGKLRPALLAYLSKQGMVPAGTEIEPTARKLMLRAATRSI